MIRTEYTPGQWIAIPPEAGGGSYYEPGTYQEVREHYEYYEDGTLGGIRMTRGTPASEVYNGVTGLWDPPASIPAAAASGGPLRSYFSYDLMGRQVSQSDSNFDGTATVHSRSATYNKIGQLTWESDSAVKYDGKTYTVTSSYSYVNAGSQYLLGSVYQVTGTSAVTGAATKGTLTTNTYQWFDGAVQSLSQYDFFSLGGPVDYPCGRQGYVAGMMMGCRYPLSTTPILFRSEYRSGRAKSAWRFRFCSLGNSGDPEDSSIAAALVVGHVQAY